MIAELKPYPAMKDSGVPWLGNVPEHWGVRRLRNVVDMRVSDVDKHTREGEQAVRLCNYIDVYKHDRIHLQMSFMRATASADEIARFRLETGDVLITKDSEVWTDIGVPALVKETADDLICGYHLALLRSLHGRLNGEYLFRALQSTAVAYQFHVEANGVTRYGLSHAAIKSIWLPLPPLPEQTAIVRFLDHVDQRIRRYIRAKQKLIKLLEEQKQVIIHHAVTRGLDPNVRLKASGVEWLAQIPEHWEIRRNGQLFIQRNQTGFPELPILEVSLKTGVRIRNFDKSVRKQMMSDRSKYKRAVRGDIAYNMMRMWQGAVGGCTVDGLVSPAYVVAQPLNGTEPRYYSHLFRTTAYMKEVDSYSRGIVKDRNRLYWEDFKRIASPYPPPDEQRRIADAIEKNTRTINDAITQADYEIDLIREYWTRLVADVVTGQLDVREAAAKLPDEPAEVEPLDDLETLSEEQETGHEAGVDVESAETEA
jgi:type I restriction enzyme S subunit